MVMESYAQSPHVNVNKNINTIAAGAVAFQLPPHLEVTFEILKTNHILPLFLLSIHPFLLLPPNRRNRSILLAAICLSRPTTL